MAMHMVFLICVSTYLAIKQTNGLPSDALQGHGIILDGGSSGTKLKIYKWRRLPELHDRDQTYTYMNVKQAKPSEHALEVEPVETIKYKPGIADLAFSLDRLDAYLRQLIQRASDVIPPEQYRRTPIYFMATAGLRALPADATQKLLDAIKSFLGNSTVNPFDVRPDRVRVLSGEEEAVFAWIAANYLRGFFWSHSPPSQSVGVLEMGGGSTQIAFLPDQSIYANMYPVHLAGRTFYLYAHSYLFYGQNYIIQRINEYLVALSGKKSEIENPCVLVGDNTTVSSLGKSVHIRGSANVTQCLEIIDIFLQTADDSWCYPKPCAIGRTYQPEVGGSVFYAIAAFIYAPTHLKAVDEMGRLNITLLRKNAVKYCQKTLAEVVNSGLPSAYASPYCTMGLYIPTLLTNAYGFDTSNAIYVKDNINDINIDWALGAMVLELDSASVSSPCTTSGCSALCDVTHIFTMTLLLVFCMITLLQ